MKTDFSEGYNNVNIITTILPSRNPIILNPPVEYELELPNRINLTFPEINKSSSVFITGTLFSNESENATFDFLNQTHNITLNIPLNFTGNFTFNSTINQTLNLNITLNMTLNSTFNITLNPANETLLFETFIFNNYTEVEETWPITLELNNSFFNLTFEIEKEEKEIKEKIYSLTDEHFFADRTKTHNIFSAERIFGFTNIDFLNLGNESNHSISQDDIDYIKERQESTESKKKIILASYPYGIKSEIVFDNIPVKKIRFDDLVTKENSIAIGVKELNLENAVQGYAIDPERLNFTHAEVTVTAKGNRLYKCAEWDFANDICNGEWILFKTDLIPGEDYSFALTQDDPGFMEILITLAEHLDENRTFIQDIYDSVQELDDVWSPLISDGEYVRIQFEKNLTSSNDITIFPRIVSGNPIIEVYEQDENITIAEFSPVISFYHNQVFLTSLVGEQDTFDLRIIGGSLEFDYITDPLLVKVVNFTSTTTWTVPKGVTMIQVEAWGGGAAGGGRTSSGRAGGGGGGAYVRSNITVSSGQVYNVIVGAQVNGGTGNGGNGNPSYFGDGSALYAAGGSGGLSAGGGGAGGSLAASTGDVEYKGGDGGTADATWSGGGGGGAGSTGAGGNANVGSLGTGTSELGGDGGAGRNSNGNGNPGNVYGGGGGGGRRGVTTNRNGGAGAAGYLRITYVNDTTYPTISIITPQNITYNNRTQLINISADDNLNISRIWYNWNGTSHTYTIPVLITFEEGQNTLHAWVNDTYGNLNYTNVSFTTDTIPPTLSILSPLNKRYNKGLTLLNISASDTHLDDIWYNWNGTDYIYTTPVYINFTEGQNILHVWANDTLDNLGYANSSFFIADNFCNAFWDYRQEINVSNQQSINITDYQIELSLTSSNVKSSFNWTTAQDSLRFARYNVSGDNEINLDYYIKSWNSSTQTATIIVEVDHTPANSHDDGLGLGNALIFMYYGKEETSSESSGIDTYILYDNFSLNTLSSYWSITDQDAVAGTSFAISGGTFNLTAGGSDTWTGSDQYASAYKSISGDFDARLKIVSQENSDGWAKAGLMLKNNMAAAGSSTGYAFMTITPGNNYAWQRDEDNNGFLEAHTAAGTTPFPDPAYVRMVKNGTLLTTYYSSNGNTWNSINTITISSIIANQHLGMGVTSHAGATLSEVLFDDFNVRKYLNPAPIVTMGEDEYCGLLNISFLKPDNNQEEIRYTDFVMNSSVECLRGYCGNINVFYQYTAITTPTIYFIDDEASEFLTYSSKDNITVFGNSLLLELQSKTEPWWNDNWPYRKNIELNNTNSDLSDYTIQLVIDSVLMGGSSFNWNTDNDSLRFIYFDNSTKLYEEMGYYIESWNAPAQNGTLLVKVPFLASSAVTDIFVYYGNDDAVSNSNFSSAFLFADGFFDDNLGSDWNTIDSDNYAGTAFDSSNGLLNITASGADTWTAEDQFGGVYQQGISGNVEIITKIDYEENTNAWAKGGIMVRNDMSQPGSSSGYIVMVARPAANGYALQWDSDANGFLDLNDNGGVSSFPSYVRIIKQGTSFGGYYSTDGITWTKQGADVNLVSALSSQDIGLYFTSHSAGVLGDISFDWIKIKTYASSPVTYSGNAEEESLFESNGFYISESVDTGSSLTQFQNISWNTKTNSNTSVDVYTRTSADSLSWSSWFKETNNTKIQSEDNRYIQYRALLDTSNTKQTPILNQLTITYTASMDEWDNMQSADTFFTTVNPYNCGIMNYTTEECISSRLVKPNRRGEYSLRFYANSSSTESLAISAPRNVSVFMQPQISTFTSSEEKLARGDSTELIALLLDDTASPLKSYNVSFYDETHNGTRYYIGSAFTNTQGYATITYTIPDNSDLGNHILNATYLGSDENYIKEAHKTTEIIVSSNPQISDISVTPEKIGFGYNLTINANISDEIGLDAIWITITNESAQTSTYEMNSIGGGIYTHFFGSSWEVQDYIFQIFANNTDGIETSSFPDSFSVEVYGGINIETVKDDYKNMESVQLKGDSENFYSGWKYRKQINIDSSSTFSDYSFRIDLDSTNFDFTKASSNGSDIRFSYYNNTISQEQVANYWIESWDSSTESAIIWVKVPSISTSENRIYVYYGNTTAESEENPSEVFIFFDGFDGTSFNSSVWTSTHAAGMTVSGGRIRINSGSLYTDNPVAQSDDIIFESKLRWHSGTGTQYAGMMAVDVQNMQGNNGGANANVLYMTQNDGAGSVMYWMGDGTVASYNLGSGSVFTRTDNTDYILGIGFNGTNNILFRDYNPLITRGPFNEPVYLYLGYFTGSTSGTTNIQDINVSWIRGRNFVNSNIEPTIDIFGPEESLSQGLVNTGTTSFKGYLRMLVQRWTGTEWQNIVPPVLDQDLYTVNSLSYLDLSAEWLANGAWSTSTRDPGIYRVYSVLEDLSRNTLYTSDNLPLIGYYNFTILESVVKLIELTHENEYDHSLIEYETLDNIAWINATVKALDNIAYNANITLSLIDELSLPAGWGPIDEFKSCGTLLENQTCEKKWDNSSNGYYIPDDVSSGSYNFFWDVKTDSRNGEQQINRSLWFTVHNIPSTVNSVLEDIRINKPDSTIYNFTFTNLWSKNLTNVVLQINCPEENGFNCSSLLSGTHVDYIGNMENGTSVTISYNITANTTVPSDNYNISVNLNYTNPSQEEKSWENLGIETLEVRMLGILYITDYYHPIEITRNHQFDLKAYMNNTAETVASDAWLNYTLPSGWSNTSGSRNKYYASVNPDEIKWNNITVMPGISSKLGPVNVRLDTSASDGRADFKIYSITTYANSTLAIEGDKEIVNRGENITITATLRYDNGSVLTNQNVAIYDQTTNTFLGSGLTNSLGKFSAVYYVNSTSPLGIHTINSSYGGSLTKYTRQVKNITTIAVHEVPAINGIHVSPEITGYGKDVKINATITDGDDIDEAWMTVEDPDGNNATYTLNFIPSSYFYYTFNDTWKKGDYKVIITANDTTGALSVSGIYNFSINPFMLLTIETEKNTYSQNEYVNLTHSNSTSSNIWWNKSWGYSKIVNITGISKNMTDYQIRLSVGTGLMYSGSKIRNDCGDIRFVYYEKDTATFDELEYLQEGICNISSSANTTYWVKTPFMHTPYTEIYIYYGNENAQNESIDETEMFDFFDGFDGASYNSSIWTSTNAPGMSVSGGRIRINSGSLYTNNPVAQSDNTIFESQIRWIASTGSDYAGMMTVDVQNMQGSNNGADANVLYMTNAGGSSTIYYYMGDGTVTGYNLGSGTTGFDRVSNTDYVLGIGFNGTRTFLFRDYNPVLNRGTFNESVYLYLGAFTGSGAGTTDIQDINVSWIRARRFMYPEPSYSFTSENTPGSKIFNNGYTDNFGYLLMKVQKNNSGVWQDVDVLIEDYVLGNKRTINSGGLELSGIWNNVSWFTSDSNSGMFRAYAELQDNEGNVLLSNNDEEIKGYHIFIIEEPDLDLDITNIKIYEVTDSLEANWHIYTNDFVGQGLNKTFNLYTNHIYRIEVDVSNAGESNWSIDSTNLTYYGLDNLWDVDEENHIWYSNKSTIGLRRADSSKEGGTFDGDTVWNTSFGGNLQPSANATFFFIVNMTSQENTPVNFKITHPTFTLNDYSVWNTVTYDPYPPVIINSNYNLTSENVIRGQSIGIYGQWNEEISESNATYNTVGTGVYTTLTNTSPQNAGNWTNFTIQSYSTWYLGKHSARLIAKDLSNNINDTLPFLNFTVWGLAKISSISLNKTPIEVSETVKLSCKIVDSTSSNSPVQNYNVTFYNSTGILGTALTDVTGWARIDYTDNTPGSEYLNCSIFQDNVKYYQIGSQNKSSILLSTLETNHPTYTTINGPVIVHKGETVSLDVYWHDDFALSSARLSTNATGWANVSNKAISGTDSWANFSYQIPLTLTPGILGWIQYAWDTSGNINQTPIQSIAAWGYSKISASSINPSSVELGLTSVMTCKVIDANDSTDLSGYEVAFWYKNSTESDYNYLDSNLTLGDGNAYYTINLSSSDLYTIKCNISDDADMFYNSSSPYSATKTLNVVSGGDTTPPQIIGNNYSINVSSVYRGECFTVSGLWDESIGFAYVKYNKSPSDIVQVNISAPYTGNWTNVSICTNETWETGNYSVKLFARDLAGNTNEDLEYKFVLVKARAKVYWVSPTGNVNRSSSVGLVCQVRDYDTNQSISGYPVTFYDGDLGYSIGNANTNSTGYSRITHNYQTHPVGPDELSCTISAFGGYSVADGGIDEETVNWYGFLNAVITNPSAGKIFHRGNTETLTATVVDENSAVITPTTLWYNTTNSQIASGKSTTWSVPNSYELGPETIKVAVSKTYYNPDNASVGVNIWGYSKITLLKPSAGYYKDNVLLNITCKVTDDDSLGVIQNYPVEFFEGVNSLGFSNTNSTGHALKQINTNTLTEGSKTLKCIVYDNSTLLYNRSATYQASVSVTIDKTVPGIFYNPNTDQNGTYSRNNFFVNVSVSESNVESVLLYVNSVPLAFQHNAGSYYWSNRTSLADGDYTFYAYIADLAGNQNQTYSRKVTLDTLAPALSIIYPVNNTYYNKTTLSLNYTAVDLRRDKCWYKLDNGALTNLPGCQNTTLALLSEGMHNVTVYSNDTVGNTASRKVFFHVDATPPNLAIQSPVDESTYTTSINIDFNFTASDNYGISKCWYKLDNGALTNLPGCLNITLLGLSNLNHTLLFYANDTSGNLQINSIWFLVNYSQFFATPIYPENNSKLAFSNITANVSTNKRGVGCNYSLDGGVYTPMINYSELEWYANLSSLSDQLHNLTFLCSDGINTSITPPVFFTIDTTGPVITFETPTPDDEEIIGYNSTYINISLNEDGQNAMLEWHNSSGKFNFTMTEMDNRSFWYNVTNLPDSIYYYRVFAEDSLGNPSNSSLREVTIAALSPAITITFPLEGLEYNRSNLDLNVTASKAIENWTFVMNGETFKFNPNIRIAAKLGLNQITVFGTDALGKTGNDSVSFEFNATRWIDDFGHYTGMDSGENIFVGENASIGFCWPGLIEQGQPQDEWDTCWKYRKQVNLSSASTLTNYQVRLDINLSSEVLAGKAQSDCSDIRFTYYNSVSHTDVPLSYWIEECNNLDNAAVWVKVPSISSSTKVHVYYGNNNSADASDGDATFELFDTFDTILTAEWGTNAENWAISTSEAYPTVGGTNSRITSTYNFPDSYATELKIRSQSSSGAAGYYRLGNDGGTKYMTLQMDPISNRVNFMNAGNNYYSINCTAGHKYSLTTDYANNQYKMYIDNNNTAALSLVAAASGNYQNPRFYSYAAENLYIDYIAIRKYSANHPTVSSMGPEETPLVNTTMQSIMISPGSATWNKFTVSGSFPAGTDAVFRLLNFSNSSICGDLSYGDVSSGYSICPDAFDYEDIYLYAELITNQTRITPSLINWTISWGVSEADLEIADISFISGSFIEGQNITARVNVTNNGNANSGNFRIQMNISFWNGTKTLSETINSSLISVGPQSSTTADFIWTAKIGTYIFDADADFEDSVSETDENNNQLSRNLSISAWHIMYGNFSYRIILRNSVNNSFTNWTNEVPAGNSYFADADADYMPFDLLPMNGTDDLEEADIALGIVGFNDSISRLFDRNDNNIADEFKTIEIAGVEIANIPIVNSTDRSSFITGLLYDSADGIGYDGNQDIVFVTVINASTLGKYGVYDYEIRVPSPLEIIKPGTNIVERIDELN